MCVVPDTGRVVCIGNATTTDKLSPPANVAFHAVTVGDDFSCGLTAVNSSLRCWGDLPGGTAQLPPSSTFFVDAHAGPRHVCGLTPNGTVLCFGDASSLGAANVPPPHVVFQGVTAGADYTCGVARNHSVVCWGDAANPVVAARQTWVAITDAEHVAAGADHACYVRVNGSVACWGSNARGGAAPPAALTSNGSVWWLVAGAGMTCALSGPSIPSPMTCWGALANNTPAAGYYEVACAGWGCVATTTASGETVVVAAVGGLPLPPITGDGDHPVVTTLAGGAAIGFADGVGSAAQFFVPVGVTADGAGGLYVADYAYSIIRRVDLATRAVTTVAGTGSPGSTVGDTPRQSSFNSPVGVEVDGAGNVYVADTSNNAIRLMSGAWVAGSTTGARGYADAAAGTDAVFDYPQGVCADGTGGLLYVADTNNALVRTVNITGTHAVGTLAALSFAVYAVALNPAARVVYAASGSAVFVVPCDGSAPTLLAGDDISTGYADDIGGAARFNYIYGLAVNAAAGVVYVSDSGNQRIRRITIDGGVVTTLAGSGATDLVDGVGTAAAFNYPWGMVVDVATGALYIGGSYNNAIQRVQLRPTPATLADPPLPLTPLAPDHQLVAWRALGTRDSAGEPALDVRGATFAAPLSPANTAGLNPVIRALLLGNITLAPRNATPDAAGNTDTSFSTSAQRGLRSLSLATLNVPTAAVALPALTTLTLTAPAPTQQLQLTSDSFVGLGTLACVNCAGVVGLANLSGLRLGNLVSQAPHLLLITALDASAAGITAVYEHDFDGWSALRWLSLADNNLTFVSDTAFSAAKQPALATIDQSRTPLTASGGVGCIPTTYLRLAAAPSSGMFYLVCSSCPAGDYCAGGTGPPVPCGANTFAVGAAAACAPCPSGTYAERAALYCMACLPSLVAPGCNATASWRDTITLVADGAGAWVNASIYLVPAGLHPAAANVSCGPVTAVSINSVSCALPFLLPGAATAPVLTAVWVTHAGTGGIPQRLGANVTVMPPPAVALTPGGGLGLTPHTAGSGRVVLRLPAPRLAAADWNDVGLQPPAQAVIDKLVVWLGGVPCTEAVWESSTTLSCTAPASDAVNVAAVVQLAGGAFNVTGVLPSLLLTTPALGASAELQLLPPASAANAIMNITLTGVGLCGTGGGGVPQLTAASVAGVPCAAIGCIPSRSDAALCVGWNTSHPAVGTLRSGSPQAAVNVSVTWVNPATRPVTCTTCVALATRPVVTSITPTSIATSGVPLVIAGIGMMDATGVPPTVLIGGEACSSIVGLSLTVVQCTTPTLLASAPGYPVVPVVVINSAGAASTEAINLTYPVTFAVSWLSVVAATTLPGGVLAPAPTLRVLSREAASCSLAINMTACTASNLAAAARPTGMAASASAAALAVGASSSAVAVSTDLLLDALTVTGASGCAGTLTASCIDAVGQSASTAGQPNPVVTLAGWRANWNVSSVPAPFIVVPDELPTLTAAFTLEGGRGELHGSTIASTLSCLALLLPISVTAPPLNKSLDFVSSRDVLASTGAAVVLLNASSAGVVFTGLTASAARLGQALALYAECTWTPTGERVRLPAIPLSTAQMALDWVAPPTTVLGYAASLLQLTLSIRVPAAVGGSATVTNAECEVVLVNATTRSTQVTADAWTVVLDAAAPVGTTVAMSVNVTGGAAPAVSAFIRASCVAWGQSLVSPPLRLITATLAQHLVSVPPASFIASDASSSWPVEPELAVVVAITNGDAGVADIMNVTDATCSLSTTTTGVELKVAGGSASSALLSIASHPVTGVVAVPRFYVQTATTTPTVDFVIDCRRTSGDAPPSLHLSIPAIRLTAQLCSQPVRDSFVGAPLPAFAIGIVATPPAGAAPTTPCSSNTPSLLDLPSILCTIGLDASTTTTNDTSNIFLQHTVATMSASAHRAEFDTFTIVAPQGQTYGLTLSCAVGGLTIPPSMPFTVTLAGCPAGQESQGVTCVVFRHHLQFGWRRRALHRLPACRRHLLYWHPHPAAALLPAAVTGGAATGTRHGAAPVLQRRSVHAGVQRRQREQQLQWCGLRLRIRLQRAVVRRVRRGRQLRAVWGSVRPLLGCWRIVDVPPRRCVYYGSSVDARGAAQGVWPLRRVHCAAHYSGVPPSGGGGGGVRGGWRAGVRQRGGGGGGGGRAPVIRGRAAVHPAPASPGPVHRHCGAATGSVDRSGGYLPRRHHRPVDAFQAALRL